ncbi:MAG: hypothetical protein K5656_08705, partial [Lachnospiraceae bacterium]|nr:hypothetical protein [Lachnospiraceae bacterium]
QKTLVRSMNQLNEGYANIQKEGKMTILFELVQDGEYPIERAALRVEMSVAEFEKQMIEKGYHIPDPHGVQ